MLECMLLLLLPLQRPIASSVASRLLLLLVPAAAVLYSSSSSILSFFSCLSLFWLAPSILFNIDWVSTERRRGRLPMIMIIDRKLKEKEEEVEEDACVSCRVFVFVVSIIEHHLFSHPPYRQSRAWSTRGVTWRRITTVPATIQQLALTTRGNVRAPFQYSLYNTYTVLSCSVSVKKKRKKKIQFL